MISIRTLKCIWLNVVRFAASNEIINARQENATVSDCRERCEHEVEADKLAQTCYFSPNDFDKIQ